jgi:recombination protein U
MESFEKQDGVAFFLIYFTAINEFYYLPYRKLREFWDRAQTGGRKSFRHDELDLKYVIGSHGDNGILIPYLDALAIDLDERD